MRPHPRFLPLALLASACAHEARPDNRAHAPAPVIEVFSEPSAVYGVVRSGGGVYVATSQGLDRWEVGGGARRRLAVPGPVRALALDRNTLWFVAAAGVGRVDLDGEKVQMLPPPPAPLAPALAGAHFLVIDRSVPQGAVWIGSDAGLFHAGPTSWNPTALRREVTALHATVDGALWIGTREGAFERNPGGVITAQREGSTLERVTAIADGPDGATVVFGEDAARQPVFAVWSDGAFSTYRLALPAAPLERAAHRDGDLLVSSPGRLLALHLPGATVPGVKQRVDVLTVEGRQKSSPYAAAVLDVTAPPDVTSLAAGGDAIYLGTRTLGTTVLSLGATSGLMAHLRPRELVTGARSLTVACREHDDCYLATGGTAAWRYDGHEFSPLVIGQRPVIVLAVVRSPQGEVLAMYREPAERRIHVARLARNTFQPVVELKIETPSGAALLSFAKFAPDGLLWCGLQYVDDDGDTRSYGVAVVDVTLGAVSYHHEGAKGPKAVLPVPNDVVDVAFQGDETWFASGSGAARMRGEKIRVWTEADALKSEILHGIVATEGGLVFVASSSGVGQFDGTRWSYPALLATVTSALARGLDGKLWLGTEHGLVAYDGRSVARYDRSAGLLDDRIFDVAVDFTGRVWARGPEGISVVTP